MKAQVYAVIVTYGNRHRYFMQVVNALLEFDALNIIIVSNNAASESISHLRDLELQYPARVQVLYLQENTGSANGFKTGISHACGKEDCEFIWLFDDDNKPEPDALNVLLEFWDRASIENKEEMLLLVSYRENLCDYKDSVVYNKPWLHLGRKNSFRSFHVFDYIQKVLSIFKSTNSATADERPVLYGEITAAPYGGSFFHKHLIDGIGYPDERFFLYYDDYDFTYRITKRGGKIFLLLNSIIIDVDQPFHVKKHRSAPFHFALSTDFTRLYYSVRNSTFFETRNFTSNVLVYTVNLFVFAFLVISIGLFHARFKNIKLFITAVYDGLMGKITNPSLYNK